jgi:hypothetical protein
MSNDLARLVGGRLGTVSFVVGYVEFRIDYNILRALTPPRVTVGSASFSFPEVDSRDALCELIDSTITAADEIGAAGEPSWRIELVNDRGHILTIPLGEDDSSYEHAHLVPADKSGRLVVEEMSVW